MENADMPAMPILNKNGAPHFIGDLATTKDNCTGLSKREMFAMHAPSEIPNWFHRAFEESDKFNLEEFIYKIKGCGHMPDEVGLTHAGEAAIYFAWKAYHASALLKELEK